VERNYTDAGVPGALVDRNMAAAAKAASRRKGYLDGRNLAEIFAWLRPGDLIWNYWANNYLLGRKAAPFDILFWNADTTRMSVQRLRGGPIGATRARLAEQRGASIAKVAAARKLLTLVFYGLRDGHIRCLARPA
jgi:polyhydroxyalkanoate synthase